MLGGDIMLEWMIFVIELASLIIQVLEHKNSNRADNAVVINIQINL